MRAVRFDRFGPPDVLTIDEVPLPEPGPGQVRIRVVAAGLNRADGKVRQGLFRPRLPRTLPSGIGFDAAGTVDAVGPDVTGFDRGDEVFALTALGGLAEYAIARAGAVARRPPGLSWHAAGGFATVGQTALDVVASQELGPADVVLVSAAAGGVGGLVAQLARQAGAAVIGSASARNAAHLIRLGVIPVRYGPGMAERLIDIAPDGITVVFDQAGEETVRAALDLGVPATRINTIAADATVLGVRGVGQGRPDVERLEMLAAQVAAGALRFPIDAVFPLESAADAYEHLELGHSRGKVIVAVEPTRR